MKMRTQEFMLMMIVMIMILTPTTTTLVSAEVMMTKGNLFNMIWKKAWESQNQPTQVDVPYANCGKSTDHMKITGVTANDWPPQPGTDLVLNVTGTVDEKVTSGQYNLAVTYYGITIILENGDLSKFLTLPAGPGEINISYSEELPSSSPAGPYVVTISATDQNNEEILCMVVKFSLNLNEEEFHILPYDLADDDDDDDAEEDESETVDNTQPRWFQPKRINPKDQ